MRTERALDTIPTRTRYPDDHFATRSGEFKRLWTVWKEWIVAGRPLLGWQFQLRAFTAQRGGAPMAVVIIRQIKTYHEQELARKNAAYGGTWNGKKWGWPREAISDFVFPSRTDPEAGARNFWAEEIKELTKKANVDDFKRHDLRRQGRDRQSHRGERDNRQESHGLVHSSLADGPGFSFECRCGARFY